MSGETGEFVYLVTMVGVYDQGSGGVFTTREAAESHAEAMWRNSDCYHTFRIDELGIDEPLWTTGRGDPLSSNRALRAERQRKIGNPVVSFVACDQHIQEPPAPPASPPMEEDPP